MPNTIHYFKENYLFLSNFWPCVIMIGKIRGNSVEHMYQALKTTNKTDMIFVLEQKTPGMAKAIGRRIKCREGWDKVKDGHMLDLLRLKFQNPSLQKMLLATGNALLEEGNHWGDTYWGICRGKGENKLGKYLMQVRTEIAFSTPARGKA